MLVNIHEFKSGDLDSDRRRIAMRGAFDMASVIFKNNDLLEQGIQPTGDDGYPLYVEFIPDVTTHITACYGDEPGVHDAIATAFNRVNHIS